jgi:hypothetical protein
VLGIAFDIQPAVCSKGVADFILEADFFVQVNHAIP